MSLPSPTTDTTDTVPQPVAECVPESWLRAKAWVTQADQERARTHNTDVAKLVQEGRDRGWIAMEAEDVEEALTRTHALLVARNISAFPSF
jgi:hypothetical protein